MMMHEGRPSFTAFDADLKVLQLQHHFYLEPESFSFKAAVMLPLQHFEACIRRRESQSMNVKPAP
jgi:hypothetical protein